MIILKDRLMGEARFRNEREIEDLVLNNSDYFFGPSSVLIPKAKISTRDGAGTIPDGFAVDLESRNWYVMEAELGEHSVWSHIAPQVSKQLLASRVPETRRLLVEIIMDMYREDSTVQEKFDELGIEDLDVHRVLESIFETEPIVAIPIDEVCNDLREWAGTLRNDVRLWVVHKFVKSDDSSDVAYQIPEEFTPPFPVVDSSTSSNEITNEVGHKGYGVSVLELIKAGLLDVSAQLVMRYGPKGKRKRVFTATVTEDGNIDFEGQVYTSLSYAAVACMQAAGSERKTVNGWTKWRVKDGALLAELRDEYLQRKQAETVAEE